jgi:AcrR family transcriptional regulator
MRAHALDAALNLFATHGIAPTSLRDIARAAGVTPALLH